ncbi:MAG: hypothetical protein ACD_20C00330G0004 [uncultured bacterium]|nr:MAG: hypothetical protein ACD_20C00330G0004 [uncultured bacterium]
MNSIGIGNINQLFKPDLNINTSFGTGGLNQQSAKIDNDKSIFEALNNNSGPQMFNDPFKFDIANPAVGANTANPALDVGASIEAFMQMLMALLNNLAPKAQLQDNQLNNGLPTAGAQAVAPAATQIGAPALAPVAGTLNKQATGDNSGKLAQALALVKDYAAKTGNPRLIQALQDGKLQISGSDLPEFALGMQEGNSIQLNNKHMNSRSVEQIASTIVHELNHYAKGSTQNSLQEEMESEQMAEDFLDFTGKGEFNDTNETALIDKSVRQRYSGMGLPETA